VKFKIVGFVILIIFLVGALFAYGKLACIDYGIYAGNAPRYIEECRKNNIFMAGLLKIIDGIFL